MTIKSYPETKFRTKLSKDDLKLVVDSWKALSTVVKKHVE